MSDIASLGIKVESNLKTLNKDMEKTISLSEKVTDATEKMKAQMAGVSSTTKNVITEEVKRQRSVDNLIKSLTLQEIKLREGKIGLDNYKASILGATEAEKKQIAALNTSIKSMQDANAAAKKHDSVLGSLISRLSALGAAYLSVQGLKSLGNALLDTAVLADNMKYSISSASGSMEKGAEAQKFLAKEAERLGLFLPDIYEGFVKITAASRGTSLEGERTRGIFVGITQAATALHLSSVQTEAALRAISDMMTKGVVQSQDFKKQFGEALPGGMQDFIQYLGISGKELMKFMEKATLTSEEFIPVIERALKGKYTEAVEEAADSTQSNLNRMKQSWTNLKIAVVEGSGDAMKNMLKDITKEIKALEEAFKTTEGQEKIKDYAYVLRTMGVAAIYAADGIAYVFKQLDKILDPEFWLGDNGGFDKFLKQLASVGKAPINNTGLIGVSKETLTGLSQGTDKLTESTKKLTKAEEDLEKAKARKMLLDSQNQEGIQKITDKIKEQASEAGKTEAQIQRDKLISLGMSKQEADANYKIMLSTEAKNQAIKDGVKAVKDAAQEEKKRLKFIDDYVAKLEQEADTYKKGKEYTADYVLSQKDATEAQKQRAMAAGALIDAAKNEEYWEKKRVQQLEDFEKLMKRVYPSFEGLEKERQEAIELTAKIYADKLIPVLGNTIAMFKILDERENKLSAINSYFDSEELKKFKSGLSEVESAINSIQTTSFGNDLADGINNAVISMRALNNYLEKQTDIEDELNKKREEAKQLTNEKDRKKALKEVNDLEHKNITNQLSGYRQLFGTTSQLFKENSREREVMHNIEMAFAAAEIAMNLEKTISAAYLAIAESGTLPPPASFAAIAAMTALMAGIVAAAGGSLSGGGSASAPSVATAAPQSTVLGSTEQSHSISSSFEFLQDIESGQYNELKDISSSMKDLNKNITGLVTSIVRTGGVSDFAGVAGTQKTGPSILQSAGAAFQTMGFSLLTPIFDTVNKTAKENEAVTQALTAIAPLTLGTSLVLSSMISNASGALFGGTRKTSILASGLQVTPGSIGSGDISTQAYADIVTKKDGGLWGSDKKYPKTLTEEVDKSVSDMMTKVFKNMGQTMVDIAKGLGTDNLEEVFNYVFDIGKIDLKGLDTEGINKAITEALSTASDSAAATLFGDLIGQYQQIGEGILDTAVRLIADKAIVADVLKMTGQGFADSNIPAKALEVSESLIELAGGLDNLIDSSATYYDKFFKDSEKQERLYGQLTEGFASLNLELPATRDGYRDLVEAQDLNTESERRNYIALLGLAEGSDKYYSVIEEGKTKTEESIQAEIDLATTRKEAVKKAERSLTVDLLTAQGKTGEALALSRKIELESMDELLRPMKLRIWALQDEAKNTELSNKKLEEEKKAAQDAQKALDDLAKARKSELETLIKNTVQMQIDGYQAVADAANEALSKAEGLLTRSFEAEKSRLTAAHEQILKSLTKNVEDAQTVVDNLKSTFDSLGAAKKAMVLSGTSQISYKMAQDQLFSAVGMAKQGDFSGASAVAADTSALTQDTMGFYSSFEDYQREFFKTKNAITELESLTGNELSVQETMVAILQNQLVLETASFDDQIKKLDDQLDGILNVDKSVINLTDAITQYQDAQNAADGANENLKKQTAILNNMMTTLFNTGVVTGNLYSLVDEYTHPEKYAAPEKITTVATAEDQKTTNEDLIRQVKILTDTVERGNYTIAKNTQATAKTVDKIYVDGAGTI